MECNDVETYKNSLKDELDGWIKQLTNYAITDFMILIVETIDMKKKNLLPRQNVLDKLRLDYGSKNGDRCVSILNPLKFENKSTESFRSMIQRIRHLMFVSYNKNITKFEEIIRATREQRTIENWSFINYFLLQEQLALVFEMLGQYSDALVQYDELDAMLNLFIMNTVFGEKQKWMAIFEQPLYSFRGITMCKKDLQEMRNKIVNQSITIIELRNYIFMRQCILLENLENQWEIAQRLFPFLFSTLREIDALRLEVYSGSLACWQFVNCLEVLNLCDGVIGTENIIRCSQYTASIWSLAKDKLYELGKLCGLLPGVSQPTSEQLHIVVQLSSAIGESPERDEEEKKELEIRRSHSPSRRVQKAGCVRLREALGSSEAFKKLYLELCELAISTYKHVSRLRSARYVGKDLANFYCALNEPQKAIVFFLDLLRELKAEKWNSLASQTLLELANCYKKLDDSINYTKTCAAISCCVDLEMLVRTFYFDEYLKSLKNIKPEAFTTSNTNLVSLEDHFKLLNIQTLMASIPIIQDNVLEVEIKIESNFPREIICNAIAISFELVSKAGDRVQESNEFDMLPFSIHLDYKQDNTLNGSSIICDSKNKVRRTSSGKNENLQIVRHDFKHCATIEGKVLLQPGMNSIILKSKSTLDVGNWIFKQVSINYQNFDFLSKSLDAAFLKAFEITSKPSSASLQFTNLVAGLEQNMKLLISGGSFSFPKEEASIVIKCTKGLRFKFASDSDEKYQRTLSVQLNDFKLFEERAVELKALCELPCRRDDSMIEQKVILNCPWSDVEIQIPLKFMPILSASCRLHSSGSKKFLQVIVKSIYEKDLILKDAVMKCTAEGVQIVDLNPKFPDTTQIVLMKNMSASYLYEIEVEPLKTTTELPIISIEFILMYAEIDFPDNFKRYVCPFDVTDYNTLFQIKVKIATEEQQQICRVGTVCHLNLTIMKTSETVQHNDLMYEILYDQQLWAVSTNYYVYIFRVQILFLILRFMAEARELFRWQVQRKLQ